MVKYLILVPELLVVVAVAAAADTPKVEFRDGDRIALVGNEFFERDQDQGYLETALTTRFPQKNLIFRNLGYSGDTVWADARSLCSGWATFGPADQGFERLKKMVADIKPTLILVAYGMNESFDGPRGLDHFVTGLNRMLDMLAEASGGARVALISPIRHEYLGPPLPDPAEHNKNIRLYMDAMEEVARRRRCAFVDLYDALGDGMKAVPPAAFTSDGIHLNAYGYWQAAQALERAMGYPPRIPTVELKRSGDDPGADSQMNFVARGVMLPLAPPPGMPAVAESEEVFRIAGLDANLKYTLKSAGHKLATASGEQWAKGVTLRAGPDFEQEESLRKLVISKNFDFFNYWRPQNDTYIFGYRNHEQGRNAPEIARFDKLVTEKEAEIEKLREPASHEYVLAPDAAK